MLSSEPEGEDPTAERHEARVAATALLVEAALADGIYADVESALISELIAETFTVDAGEAAKILADAEQQAEASVDHYRFTKVVKHLPAEEREKLIESLWRVVFADGEESPFEDAFVRRVSGLLHVNDRANRLARQRARDAASKPASDPAPR